MDLICATNILVLHKGIANSLFLTPGAAIYTQSADNRRVELINNPIPTVLRAQWIHACVKDS